MLCKVDSNDDFHQDIDYVKQKWLDELLVARKRREDFLEETWERDIPDADDAWMVNREGTPPWRRVDYHLDDIQMFWWRNLGGREQWRRQCELAGETVQLEAEQAYGGRYRDPPEESFKRTREGFWSRGPSRVKWDIDGWEHLPSTWDTLNAAADMDIEWLKGQVKAYQWDMPEPYNKNPLPIELEHTGSEEMNTEASLGGC